MKGRGALSNPANRYQPTHVESDQPLPESLDTEVSEVNAGTIISRNQSPDVPFDQSINAYRGCEHGCIYCFARPTHAYLDLSPGLDFETKLFAKRNAAELLRNELAKPSYRPRTIALGTNTDPYQPIERRYRITRQLLEVFLECQHPVSVVTKGSAILRDVDLLKDLAEQQLTQVLVSLPSLSRKLKRSLEPRAPSPTTRLRVIEALAGAGIPTGTLIAPVIPKITDHELEAIIEAVANAGGTTAGYVLLRLPLEVRPLFEQWMQEHYPHRAKAVMSHLQQMHGGPAYDPRWRKRQTGEGPLAQLLAKRFQVACARFGLNQRQKLKLRIDRFKPPSLSRQIDLF